MQYSFFACYPAWLVSTLMLGDYHYSEKLSPIVTISEGEVIHPDHVPVPQPQTPSQTIRTSGVLRRAKSPPYIRASGTMRNSILARSSPPPQSKPEPVPTFDRTPQAHMTPRIPLPLPFSAPCLADANRVEFSLRGCRGVSLSEWARLAEKRKTHLALDDPHASLEDVFESEEQGQLLFQSHVSLLHTLHCLASLKTRTRTHTHYVRQWPGYDVRTCFLDMPQHVAAGEGPLTRVSLLDMVCQALVDWVVNISVRARDSACAQLASVDQQYANRRHAPVFLL